MTELKQKLNQIGLIPVIKITDVTKAVPLAEALIAGELPAAEITFRTEGAAAAIEKIRCAYPDMLIGAGTVLTEQQLLAAKSAGASFVVSPGLQPKIVEASLRAGMPIVPGCMTPTEIETAMSFGLNFVKFFPAEAAGGIRFLKAVSAPYAGISFMPTGGITMENLTEYLSLKCVVCCGGSFVAEEKDIATGNFELIRQKAALTVAAIRKD